MQGIYKITNKINGKIYIGQSVNIEERFKSHKYTYNNPKANGYNTKFYRALRKYGIENFTFEIVEEVVNKENLNKREIFWIQYYNSYKQGYNSTLGGDVVTENCELHPNAKHTNHQILNLKNMIYSTNIPFRELGKMFTMSESEISQINTGKKWTALGNYNYPIRQKEYRHKGESHFNSKLTDEIVNLIRKRYVNENAKEIFKDFKYLCSYSTFERALMGRTFTYLPIYKKKDKKWINKN